jgi:hypothetical protein
MSYLTIDDIRLAAADHTVIAAGFDLEFSDDEIVSAMKRCARDFNSIPPFVCRAPAHTQFPDDTNIFIDGTLKQLYLVQFQKLMRDDIPYQAGAVQVDDVKRKLEHVKDAIKLFGDQFVEAVGFYKRSINIRAGYGPIG